MRRLAPDQSGTISLIELIVVSMLLVMVLSVTLFVLNGTAKRVPREQERAHSIREVQVGLHRMTRELRQAYSVNGTGYTYMDVNVSIGGQNRRVRYDCSVPAADPLYRTCVRYEAPAGQELPVGGLVVIDRLLNGTSDEQGRVFYADHPLTPTFARARVEVPAKGELKQGFAHKVVLDDGFYMRNLKLG
jgi:hypothetical protein